MKAFVDIVLCTGCGLCPLTCPEVFKIEDDHAIAYTNPVPQKAKDSCRTAAEECPVEAITIIE